MLVPLSPICVIEVPRARLVLEMMVQCPSDKRLRFWQPGPRRIVADHGLHLAPLEVRMALAVRRRIPFTPHALQNGFALALGSAMLEEVKVLVGTLPWSPPYMLHIHAYVHVH